MQHWSGSGARCEPGLVPAASLGRTFSCPIIPTAGWPQHGAKLRPGFMDMASNGGPKKSERPVGVPAALGHGGNGGAETRSRPRVARLPRRSPFLVFRRVAHGSLESTDILPAGAGSVDRPLVQFVAVQKYCPWMFAPYSPGGIQTQFSCRTRGGLCGWGRRCTRIGRA